MINKADVDYTLYLVTDRGLMSTATLEEAVENSIKGGCTVVQLREKDASSREFYDIAMNIKRVTDHFNVPLIINDRVDIALAMDAAGIHIGQGDLPAKSVRKIIGADKILGVSASSLNEALNAQMDGADYLGIGAMFKTGTKTDASIVTIDELNKIRKAVAIPLVVIGGINERTIPMFNGTDIDGVAVVSAIIASNDITAASASLKNLFLKTKESGNA
ncbi:MAG: thiamine phosphate synthase [Bacillota bacterium]|nr:thiamine phosphate synthase [Bacillota bacterium]